MKVLCSPSTSVELAVVESLLNAEKIPYFVHNEHFGGLEVGPAIPLVNERAVFVSEEDFERASGIIAVPPSLPDATPTGGSVSVFAKLRMVVEVLLLGWLLPAQRKHRDASTE